MVAVIAVIVMRDACTQATSGTVFSKTTLEENNCNRTKLDMLKSDADVTVSGERGIDAVIRMKQGPSAVHCIVPEDCDRITVGPVLYSLIYIYIFFYLNS
jgi:hypothetical protein